VKQKQLVGPPVGLKGHFGIATESIFGQFKAGSITVGGHVPKATELR